MTPAQDIGQGIALSGVGLRKSYRGRRALDVDRVDIPAGQALALLGPSGSGKSTLLAILGLLMRPDAGRVLLGGEDVSCRDRYARLRMAAVFQRPYLFKGTVADNVAYGLKLRSVRASERGRRVADALQHVGLAEMGSRSALTLSGGEAQRVALARALVLRPDVLLLDEPLASLDPLEKGRLAREFARILAAEAVTTLYVTHDQDEAMVVAPLLAIMRGGRLVASGPTDEVASVHDDEWTASFFGMGAPLKGVVGACEEGLARIVCESVEVFAVAECRKGERVSLGIRPEDVLLFEAGAEMPHSTARNRLPCVVESVTARGATYSVVVESGGVRLAAAVSRAAVADLGLAPGIPAVAVFKATAVRVRPVWDNVSTRS